MRLSLAERAPRLRRTRATEAVDRRRWVPVLPLAIVLLVAGSCGSEDAGPSSSPLAAPTVPNTTVECVVDTTIPGQTTEPLDPRTCDTTVRVLPATCDDAPLIAPTEPVGGWIDGERAVSFTDGDVRRSEEVLVDEAPGLDGLDGFDTAAIDTVAFSDRVAVHCSLDGSTRMEAVAERWVVTLRGGGVIQIDVEQLVDAVDSFNLATNSPPVDHPGGGEIIRSDVFRDGSLRTVWLFRPDGMMVRARAKGEHALSVAGWPTTTMPPLDAPEPAEAALSLDQLQLVAETVLADL